MNQGMLYELEQAELRKIENGLAKEFYEAMRDLGIHARHTGRRPEFLVWRQLALRYHVSFGYVARLVVTRYRGLTGKTGEKLGLSFPTLAGPLATRWLHEELGRDRRTPTADHKPPPVRDPELYAAAMYKRRLDRHRPSSKTPRNSPRWVQPVADSVRVAFRV